MNFYKKFARKEDCHIAYAFKIWAKNFFFPVPCRELVIVHHTRPIRSCQELSAASTKVKTLRLKNEEKKWYYSIYWSTCNNWKVSFSLNFRLFLTFADFLRKWYFLICLLTCCFDIYVLVPLCTLNKLSLMNVWEVVQFFFLFLHFWTTAWETKTPIRTSHTTWKCCVCMCLNQTFEISSRPHTFVDELSFMFSMEFVEW